MHPWISLAPSRRRILAGAASLPRCLAGRGGSPHPRRTGAGTRSVGSAREIIHPLILRHGAGTARPWTMEKTQVLARVPEGFWMQPGSQGP